MYPSIVVAYESMAISGLEGAVSIYKKKREKTGVKG